MTEDKKKAAAPKKPSEHPTYAVMIKAAIGTLKERSGSSRQAILKYIQANYKVGDHAANHLKQALKRLVAGGELKQVKGAGASGSFKIAVAEPTKKTPKKAAAKKPAAKKPAAKKAKKTVAKKAATPKKAAAAKKVKKPVAAKKPAAKKPAAKKAKKPVKKTKAKKGKAKK